MRPCKGPGGWLVNLSDSTLMFALPKCLGCLLLLPVTRYGRQIPTFPRLSLIHEESTHTCTILDMNRLKLLVGRRTVHTVGGEAVCVVGRPMRSGQQGRNESKWLKSTGYREVGGRKERKNEIERAGRIFVGATEGGDAPN